jgi:CHRD domain
MEGEQMTSLFRAISAAAAFAAVGAGPALAETMSFKADLKSGPGITSQGNGNLTATYDTESRKLSWKGNVTGLTGNPTVAHFHGPADPGQNAGVLVPAAGIKMGDFEGSATLTNDQAKVLTADKTYFMVHTPANPGGEVRGQVTKAQ